MASPTVLIVGNSDGIGLALTRRLLAQGYRVLGLSRSVSTVVHATYRHVVVDVTDATYSGILDALLADEPSPCAVFYCAGIAARTDLDNLSLDLQVFDVNLLCAVRTAQRLLPVLAARGGGRFVVLSSQADVIVNHEAASYSASKAAVSAYFEGLGLKLKLRKSTTQIVNVRFGFVDTKMARTGFTPFKITSEQAAQRLLRLLEGSAPLRVTYPRKAAVLVLLVAWLQRLRVRFA